MTLFEYIGKPSYLFDSHCHLNDVSYNNKWESVIGEALKFHVEEIWDISVDTESSKKSLNLFVNIQNVKTFVGIDPELFIPGSSMFVNNFNEVFVDQMFSQFEELVEKNKKFIFGIGETGLDYYWLSKNEKLSEKEKSLSKKLQKLLFEKQIILAEKHKLPLSIHSRGAENDCLEIVKKYKVNAIFHSYTGNYEILRRILDAGFNVGINGIITYKNAEEIRSMYRKVLGRIDSPDELYKKGFYLETDSPYLSPQSKRGELNKPTNIAEIYKFIVEDL